MGNMKNYLKITIGIAIILIVYTRYCLDWLSSDIVNVNISDHMYLNAYGQYIEQSSVASEDYHSNTTVDLRIIVITYNRHKSLTRCLKSLNAAEYFGDKVTIDIWIDKPSNNSCVDKNTLDAVSQFKFQHGTVNVHARTEHAGLVQQWLTTWVPDPDSKEIALFVEDDLTLSKFFYKWLKLVHNKYDSHPHINGFSLQGRSIKHGVGAKGMLHGPEEEVVFTYPILGSWGFSPSPKNWLHFLAWHKQVYANLSFVPEVPQSKSTKWYLTENVREGKRISVRDKIWTQWHVFHAYKNRELTVYVNLPNRTGLAINWKEPGLHFTGASKTTNSDPILLEWNDRYADLPDLPAQFDMHGNLVNPAQKHL